MLDEELGDRAMKLLDLCKQKHLTVATAESCTGGLLAAALTNIAGSSAVIDRGFVTYTNESKQEMIGVPPMTIEKHGAVSRETAEAMVRGTLAHAPADLAVSITGIAGPTGATPGKPVGLVHFGAGTRGGRMLLEERKYGDVGRSEVRRKAVLQAIAMLTELAEKEAPRAPRAEV